MTSIPEHSRIKKRRWLWIIGGMLLVIVSWHVIADIYREEEKALRSRFRASVEEAFPEESDEFLRTFGLFQFETDRKASDGSSSTQSSVVLVHGLDDPGKVWQNLAPDLTREGFSVWQLHYPNDQPITNSARLFFDELTGLKALGVQRISIVAHSMGGLVSREMLTHPDMDYGRSAENGQVPEVVSLTMLGTPNHGSQLARFRVFAEVRDHLARWQRGEAGWLGAILDGAGEAKIDLLPGSRFLTELNARPHPEGVDQLIIAGVSSPWNEGDINRWLDSLPQDISPDRKQEIDALGERMISMAHGLGDGLVTVESTRLDGVAHRTVNGTHLSMIRNITQGSQRVPPAVPIIVNRLKELDSESEEAESATTPR